VTSSRPRRIEGNADGVNDIRCGGKQLDFAVRESWARPRVGAGANCGGADKQ